jgi:hypothetical protein
MITEMESFCTQQLLLADYAVIFSCDHPLVVNYRDCFTVALRKAWQLNNYGNWHRRASVRGYVDVEHNGVLSIFFCYNSSLYHRTIALHTMLVVPRVIHVEYGVYCHSSLAGTPPLTPRHCASPLPFYHQSNQS